MPIENPTESLEAFTGFEHDLREYRRVLDEPTALERGDEMRRDLNRQLGVLMPELQELGVPRIMMIAGNEFGIFETALGPLPAHEDEMFIPVAALDQALTVLQQAIGTLERLEARKVREAAQIRSDARTLAGGLYPKRRWTGFSVVLGIAASASAGWFACRFDLFGFLAALDLPWWRWLLASIAAAVTFTAGGYAVNRLSSDTPKGKAQAAGLLVVALVAGWLTYVLTVPPPKSKPVTLPAPPPPSSSASK